MTMTKEELKKIADAIYIERDYIEPMNEDDCRFDIRMRVGSAMLSADVEYMVEPDDYDYDDYPTFVATRPVWVYSCKVGGHKLTLSELKLLNNLISR